MAKAVIGLGSNLGERDKNIRTALEKMQEKGIELLRVSSVLETEPYGYTNQPKFLNAVCLVETNLTPDQLLDVLLEIEKEMGRVRERKWGPRIIDLDIIFYEDLVLESERLIVPHPDMHNRWFVLAPLAEICPDYVHPKLKKTVRELLQELTR